MSLIYFTGFSENAVDGDRIFNALGLSQRWSSSNNSSYLIKSDAYSPRDGAFYVRDNQGFNSSFYTLLASVPSDGWVLGFSFHMAELNPMNNTLEFHTSGEGADSAKIFLTSASQVRCWTWSSGYVGDSEMGVILPGWNYVEIKGSLANSPNGFFIVRVNGKVVVSALSGDFNYNGTDYTLPYLQIYTDGASQPGNFCGFTDWYFLTCDGVYPDDFIGPVMVDPVLRPDGDGSDVEWDVYGETNNWEAVDDVTKDDDTTYIYSEIPGEINLSTLEDVGEGGSILGVRSALSAKCTPVLGLPIKSVLRVNGTNYQHPNRIELGGTYALLDQVWALNPDDDEAWEESDINALEAGVILATTTTV